MERCSETVLDPSAKFQQLSLGWDQLCAGLVPTGSYNEITFPDGLPRHVAKDTLMRVAEGLAAHGVLAVRIAPDVGVLKEVTRRLRLAGFDRCEVKRGLVSFVLRTNGSDVLDLTYSPDTHQSVLLYSETPISKETLASYRRALGPAVFVDLVAEDGGAEIDDALILVVAEGILPELKWLRPLMDEQSRLGTPVGCSVIDTNGRRVHVGGDQERGAWAAGSTSAHPLLKLTREAELLAPYLLDAHDFRPQELVTGTLLGSVQALTTADSQLKRSTRPSAEIFGPTLLVVADEENIWDLVERQDDLTFAPGKWIQEQQAEGLRVVLSASELYDPWLCAELGAAGVLLNDESVDTGLGDLGHLLQPECIAFASNARLDSDFALVTRVARRAEVVWIGSEACARVERLASAPDTVTSQFTSRIPLLDYKKSVTGVTSIVIPVYGMWELTERCLASIREHTPEDYEIVVVDDCSPDETLFELVSHDVVVVANATNLGFPGAVNAGLAKATGEFVCVLNNDTEVTPGWLTEMHTALRVEGVAMVGPRSNRITGRQAVPKSPGLDEPERAHRWAQHWSRQRTGVSWPANTLIGFCILSRRDLYEQLGGFEEGYGQGNFEDLDMSLRIRAAGSRLRVADGSVVLHHGSATFTGSGIDLDALMQQTYQRFGERDIYGGGLLTALVLSDGDAEIARKSAASAVVVADETILLERGCLFDAELLTAAGGIIGVRSLSLDWSGSDHLATFIDSLTSDWIVVLGAGEELVVNEWGRARSELDNRTDPTVGIKTPAGVQVRMHPPNVEAMQQIGLDAQNPLRRILIREAIWA